MTYKKGPGPAIIKIFATLLLAALFLSAMASCAKHDAQSAREGGAGPAQSESAPQQDASRQRSAVRSTLLQFREPSPGDKLAVIETGAGTIKAVLYTEYAPMAVENFIALADAGYYNGCEFFRILPDALIQAGDGSNTGKGGTSAWGRPFPIEKSNALKHYSGALCMAAGLAQQPGEDAAQRNGEQSPAPDGENAELMNGSQFYIVQAFPFSIDSAQQAAMQQAGYSEKEIEAYAAAGGLPGLDGGDTVFGMVIQGMDVVDKIASGKLLEGEDGALAPEKPVKILKITIEEAAAKVLK